MVKRIITFFLEFGVFSFGGCYTVLMDPSMLASSEDEGSITASSLSDSALGVSYNQNSLSCPGKAESDGRNDDMQNAGLITPHDASVDPYGWQAPASSLPWWYEMIAPVPPTAVASASPSTAVESGPRQRTIGSTRGNDRSRSDFQASAPVTITTTTTAPTPPTATVAAPTGRNKRTGNNSATSTTRKTGSNRGGGRD